MPCAALPEGQLLVLPPQRRDLNPTTVRIPSVPVPRASPHCTRRTTIPDNNSCCHDLCMRVVYSPPRTGACVHDAIAAVYILLRDWIIKTSPDAQALYRPPTPLPPRTTGRSLQHFALGSRVKSTQFLFVFVEGLGFKYSF